MMRAKWFKICLIIGILAVFSLTSAQAASEVFVHFVVFPSKTRDGHDIDKALDDLRRFFGKLAGGYTCLGSTDGGYLPPGGTLEKNANYTFIVAAPQDLTQEIEAYIPRYFETDKPYILIWKALTNY